MVAWECIDGGEGAAFRCVGGRSAGGTGCGAVAGPAAFADEAAARSGS